MLEFVILRAKAGTEEAIRDFYTKKLGLEERAPLEFVALRKESATLKFVLKENDFDVDDDTSFWKIGLTVDALEEFLEARQLATKAEQVQEVGYVARLRDPIGFAVELRQTTFARNVEKQRRSKRPLSIGYLSLRVQDAEKPLAFYRDRLGMRLLSKRQSTSARRDSYFLAFTTDSPPEEDTMNNWEWLWQRSYTTIELCHEPQKNPRPSLSVDGLVVSLPNKPYIACATRFGANDSAKRIIVRDPHGLHILVMPNTYANDILFQDFLS